MFVSISKINHHPKGLVVLFFTELWERFSYYGMRAILVLYLISDFNDKNPGLGWSNKEAIILYGWYTALVYLACIPGGIIGDRYITSKNSVLYGGFLLCAGHFTLAFQNELFFFIGLTLIILGVGLLKPNISTLVGNLYKVNDLRRDQGFTIFYIGINIGAFLASILVGYVGEVFGWHYGFSLAGFGMLLGQISFIIGKKNIVEVSKKTSVENNFSLKTKKYKFSSIELDRVKLILISSLILVIFWASFEQAGGLLNIFAYEKTNRYLPFLNMEIPASWFQSINPLLIIVLGYSVSVFWMFLKKKNMLATSIFKISIGIIIMGLGFIFMVFASVESEIYGKSSMYWLFFAYLFFTVGELCASPVILSYITKLSPKKLTASIMGIYFATIGLGNKIAGIIGQYSQALGEKVIFLGITVICVFVGGLVIIMHKRLIRLSHGVDD